MRYKAVFAYSYINETKMLTVKFISDGSSQDSTKFVKGVKNRIGYPKE